MSATEKAPSSESQRRAAAENDAARYSEASALRAASSEYGPDALAGLSEVWS